MGALDLTLASEMPLSDVVMLPDIYRSWPENPWAVLHPGKCAGLGALELPLMSLSDIAVRYDISRSFL